jgi:hypothetical protein
LITSFCDVAFKIKSLLFMVFSMPTITQLQGTNIFIFLKVGMNLDFFLIIIAG